MNRRSFFAAMAGAPIAAILPTAAAPSSVMSLETIADVWAVDPRSVKAQYLYRCYWTGLLSLNEARELMANGSDHRWSKLPVMMHLDTVSFKAKPGPKIRIRNA